MSNFDATNANSKIDTSFETSQNASQSSTRASAEPQLPPLSASDFRIYNQMSESMEVYHTRFRRTWTMLYDACSSGKRPQNMSLKQFLDTGIQFCRHLELHHSIEEQHIFPMLAERMPEFQTPAQRRKNKNASSGKGGEGGAKELVRQHEIIHKGMDGFQGYLKRVLNGEDELDLKKMKEQMDSWEGVLWQHLNEEVETLAAENMRKYWTTLEMRRMAFF